MVRTKATAPTARAMDILDHAIDYCETHHGRYPTLRHLATVFNTSTSVINFHLSRLEKFGYVGFYIRANRKYYYIVGLIVVPPSDYPHKVKGEK